MGVSKSKPTTEDIVVLSPSTKEFGAVLVLTAAMDGCTIYAPDQDDGDTARATLPDGQEWVMVCSNLISSVIGPSDAKIHVTIDIANFADGQVDVDLRNEESQLTVSSLETNQENTRWETTSTFFDIKSGQVHLDYKFCSPDKLVRKKLDERIRDKPFVCVNVDAAQSKVYRISAVKVERKETSSFEVLVKQDFPSDMKLNVSKDRLETDGANLDTATKAFQAFCGSNLVVVLNSSQFLDTKSTVFHLKPFLVKYDADKYYNLTIMDFPGEGGSPLLNMARFVVGGLTPPKPPAKTEGEGLTPTGPTVVESSNSSDAPLRTATLQ